MYLLLLLPTPAAWTQTLYGVGWDDILKAKANFDDPTHLFEKLPHKDILPPEVWKSINYDQAQMKQVWSEVVGFKAPDVVGKIAPELKPGKYTYQDKDKLPFQRIDDTGAVRPVQAGSPPTGRKLS